MRAVGVLAVMDDAADALFDAQRHSQSADVTEARAAVAELVAAAEYVALFAYEPRDMQRLRAAIAKFGGTP